LFFGPTELEAAVRVAKPNDGAALLYFFNGSSEAQSRFKVFIDGSEIGTADPGTFLYATVPAGKRVIRIVANVWECIDGPQMISTDSVGSRVRQWEEDVLPGLRVGYEPIGPAIVPASCKTTLANWVSLKTRTLRSEPLEGRLQSFRLAYSNAESVKVTGRVWHSHPDECIAGRSSRRIGTYDQSKPRRPNDYTPDGYKDAICIFEEK
jgi:hypothetical protein